jgi:hypothetical protein
LEITTPKTPKKYVLTSLLMGNFRQRGLDSKDWRGNDGAVNVASQKGPHDGEIIDYPIDLSALGIQDSFLLDSQPSPGVFHHFGSQELDHMETVGHTEDLYSLLKVYHIYLNAALILSSLPQ